MMIQEVSVLTIIIVFFGSSACDYCGKIFTEKQFTLKSENYPQPYPKYPSCFYLIKGESCTEYFEFEFKDFDIKKSVGCTEERLEIGAQDAICGYENKTKLYKAESGQLKLKFVSSRIENRDTGNRGFKLYVRRIECPSNSVGAEETTNLDLDVTNEVPFEWTTSVVATTISTPTYFDKNLRLCCHQNAINSEKFIIVSPNFPYSVNFAEECAYVITKSDPDICRLRIHLKFFYLGQPTLNSCPYGYLEIDGKFICGCNSDVNLISNFGYSNSKIINFKTFGILLRNSYSGYVLEVIQDKCPMKYIPDNTYLPPVQFRSFRSYEDKENKIAWPNESRSSIHTLNDAFDTAQNINNISKPFGNIRSRRNIFQKFFHSNVKRPEDAEIQKAKLISQKSYIDKSSPNEISNDFASIIKQVYYFAPEGENAEEDVNIDTDQTIDQDSEESSNYIDTSKINTLLTNLYEYEKCCQWNQIQFNNLKLQYGNNLVSFCRAPEKERKFYTDQRCTLLNEVAGNFISPNYPFGYPAGLNICYRFQNLPGYCKIRLFFNDFHLENSQDCRKDYIQLLGSGYRYCGNYLSKTTSIINTEHIEKDLTLNFVTDFNNSDRGFSIFYQQILCERTFGGHTSENGVVLLSSHPSHRNSSFQKRVPIGNNDSVHKPNSIGCDRVIQLETFIWRNQEISGNQECQIQVGKVNEDFCKLKLNFEEFNLNCDTEYLLIDETKYCGYLTGKIVSVTLGKTGTILNYKRTFDHRQGSTNILGMFRILGRQISDDCDKTAVLAHIPEIQRRMDTIESPDETNHKDDDDSSIANDDIGDIEKEGTRTTERHERRETDG